MTDTAPHPVAFVDTETTGLDPERHEIWEVGLILPDGTEHEWQLPVDLSRADPIALNIGRFHDRYKTTWADSYEDADWLREFAREFVALTRGLHLAGAVVSFDAERLWQLLRNNGECPMWHYHLVDVEALAAGWLAGRAAGVNIATPVETADCNWTMRNTEDGPESFCMAHATSHKAAEHHGRPPWKSNDLSRAVGVNPDHFDRHSALGDARWAKAIYEAVMG